MTDAVKIKADIMWAYLTKPNEMSGKYQVDLCNLSEKASEALESMGIDVKTKEGKGRFITCKSVRPITIYDDGGSILDGSLLGNGSKGVALVDSWEWQYQKKKGVSPGLKKLVITEYKPYTSSDVGEMVTEDDLL